jgi:Ca-activated chloride channel family protein
VGIGAAPARSLLHELASKTGGACEFVGVNDDVSSAILRTFRRMRQAPVHDIEVQWGQSPQWQSKPGKAIFSGETVHTFAGFSNHVPADAVMRWNEGKDKIQHQLPFRFDTVLTEGDTLARIAAATRRSDLPKDEQLALALQYQLVTESTNLLIVHDRAESEKMDELPPLRIAPQMIAAGWSGVTQAQTQQMKQPAVWRRENASEQIQAMQRNGVETYDIPAFLRKQPDDIQPAVFCRGNRFMDPYRYREQLTAFLAAYFSENGVMDEAIQYPKTFAEIEGKIPTAILDELRMVVELGYLESDVIRAFIVTLAACVYKTGIAKRIFNSIRHFGNNKGPGTTLEQRIGRIAKNVFDARRPGMDTYDIPAFLRKQAD